MLLADFDFDLPEDRIALRPASPRDSAKLLVVEPGRPWRDLAVRDLPGQLRAGDVLVLNPADGRASAEASLTGIELNEAKRYYVNVHASPTDLATIIACGPIDD